MRNLSWTADGCARFEAVPQCQCRLERVWLVQVPSDPDAPELAMCQCSELPMDTSQPFPAQPNPAAQVNERALLHALLRQNPQAMAYLNAYLAAMAEEEAEAEGGCGDGDEDDDLSTDSS